MVHRIEDGDIYKILPFVTDGVEKWGLEVFSISTKSGKFIHDDGDLLKRIFALYRKNADQIKHNYTTKYYFNVLINGEIKIAPFGRKIMKIIQDQSGIFDINSNKHLHIVKEFIPSHIGPLASFDKSNIIEVDNWSNREDWSQFIGKNQPDFFEFIRSKSPLKMREELIQELGHDYLGDILSEDRETKLETILNNI
jgi:hypothetical protein